MLFAVAAVAQQRGTADVPDDEALKAGMVATLVKKPIWVLGISADVLGFGVQAAALAVGSILLVQPLIVTALVFALPLAAWSGHRRMSGQEWAWGGVLVASLVVFLVLGRPSEGRDQAPFAEWVIVWLVVIPLVAICIMTASRLPKGTWRSLVLAVAAGVLLGVMGPLTKTAITGFAEGFVHGITSWEFWAMAITASLGTFWQQSSYQAGDVQTSLPAVTVLKPFVAMVLGVTLYQETLEIGRAGDLALLTSLVTMAISTVLLSRLSAPPDTPTTAPGTPPAPPTTER